MRSNSWQRFREEPEIHITPRRERELLLSKLRTFLDKIMDARPDRNLYGKLIELESPKISVFADETKKKMKRYSFYFSGLNILYPDPDADLDSGIARIDFTPFWLTNYSIKSAGAAIGAMFLGFDAFDQRVANHTSETGDNLEKPKILRGLTNRVMMEFRTKELGFHLVELIKGTGDGEDMFEVEAAYDEVIAELRSRISRQDFNQLARMIDYAPLQSILNRVSPDR